ncbi:MAG: alpha/beta hydrolase [Leptolyngbyaceae cyanobacterium SM2_5_2]|nr:alpha/beta hydrolase [Leptolyngbyaceae cyanobacterium SM2_5_2]
MPVLHPLFGSCFTQIWRGLVGFGAAITVLALPPAHAAERIEFFVGPFEPILWVDDLAALAKDGTVTERFRPFANRLSTTQLEELQRFLNWELDADLVTISQFTYWQVGERFLGRMGQVVQTDSFSNGSQALRAALIAAAAEGDSITPLEVMQTFPLETIQLDYGLLQQIIQENRRFFASRAVLMTALRAQGSAEAIALPPPASTVDATALGPYPWKVETLTFQNPLREGDIPFDLYYPAVNTLSARPGESVPVVVISHGVASGRGAFVYVARHLASHGYAVAVPQHDDDNRKYTQFLAGVDRPPNPITLVSRPRDISLTLDTLTTLAQTDRRYAALDLNNVGVLGHSLGGFTVLAAAGAEFNFAQLRQNCALDQRDRPSLNPSLLVQCDMLDLETRAPFQLQDPRIRAVFAINPPTQLFFGAEGLAEVTVPTLFVASMADIVVPAIPEQIEPYQGLHDPRSLPGRGRKRHPLFFPRWQPHLRGHSPTQHPARPRPTAGPTLFKGTQPGLL